MRSKQYFSRTKNNPHEKSTEPFIYVIVSLLLIFIAALPRQSRFDIKLGNRSCPLLTKFTSIASFFRLDRLSYYSWGFNNLP